MIPITMARMPLNIIMCSARGTLCRAQEQTNGRSGRHYWSTDSAKDQSPTNPNGGLRFARVSSPVVSYRLHLPRLQRIRWPQSKTLTMPHSTDINCCVLGCVLTA